MIEFSTFIYFLLLTRILYSCILTFLYYKAHYQGTAYNYWTGDFFPINIQVGNIIYYQHVLIPVLNYKIRKKGPFWFLFTLLSDVLGRFWQQSLPFPWSRKLRISQYSKYRHITCSAFPHYIKHLLYSMLLSEKNFVRRIPPGKGKGRFKAESHEAPLRYSLASQSSMLFPSL